MKLNAIPEVHPWNLICITRLTKVQIEEERSKLEKDPYIALTDAFWDRLNVYIKSSNKVTRFPFSEENLLALARQTWTEEVALVRRVAPTTFYLEGTAKTEMKNVVVPVAENARHKVVYVDEESIYYRLLMLHSNDIDNVHERRLQTKREGEWLEQIIANKNSDAKSDPWLFAGHLHIAGRFGLSQRLAEKNILLKPSKDHALIGKTYVQHNFSR